MSKYIPYVEMFHRTDIVEVLLDINSTLKQHHAIFRITPNSELECLEIIPRSTAWLKEFGGVVINVSDEFKAHLNERLTSVNCKAYFNNTSNCFWLIDTKETNDE